jgi:hypothetical protein
MTSPPHGVDAMSHDRLPGSSPSGRVSGTASLCAPQPAIETIAATGTIITNRRPFIHLTVSEA